LLLRDGAGSCLPVIVDAAPMPGHRAWAVETIQAAASWEAGAAPAGQQAATGYYQRVFEESVVPTILTSRSGNILEVNVRAREVLRAHEKELVGAPLAGLLADEALPAYHEAVASLAHSGRARARLTLLAQPDLILDAEAREIRGDAAFIQWVAHDVTSYVATERLRHDLVDLLLHDLRSPLATSILGVETAERALHGQDKPRAQRSLAAAGVALRRLGRLVDSLLDISHLEAGQPLHRLEEVNPVELLHVAAAEVEPALAGPGLDLQLEVPPNLPTIMADGEMFFRVVINLLDNAIKFSPRDGEVQLTATAQDRGVLICVTDRGPGIPRELQPRIFDKFIGYYLPHAPRGYGLGLSFCKLAVEAHGGWLAVDSSPGKGSTFAVWLPNRPG
jgi:PAS domain S-box-containing protein